MYFIIFFNTGNVLTKQNMHFSCHVFSVCRVLSSLFVLVLDLLDPMMNLGSPKASHSHRAEARCETDLMRACMLFVYFFLQHSLLGCGLNQISCKVYVALQTKRSYQQQKNSNQRMCLCVNSLLLHF